MEAWFEKDEEYGVWIPRQKKSMFEGFHREYEAKEGDVVVASAPKTGSTWMRAMVHSVVACGHSKPNMLKDKHPRDVVPCADMVDVPEWRDLESPRTIATHLPYRALPRSLRESEVKIVYVTRNPRDTFVSLWKFRERVAESLGRPSFTKQEYFESFCAGLFPGGPFAEHVIDYYKQSHLDSHKVLFVRYEDMKADPDEWVRKIGDFMGFPSNVVHPNASKIAEICSFDSMVNIPVNKTETSVDGKRVPPAAYFRQGKSGGWKEHFTPEMVERIRTEIEDKLEENGVRFNY